MEPVSAKISLRPVRVGFLVDPKDRASLSKVMRLATAIWGGIMCPIIPVMRRVPREWKGGYSPGTSKNIMQGYLRFFEPDVLVQTAPEQLAMLGLTEDRYLWARRFHRIDELVKKEIGLEADISVGVNMYYRYQDLFQKEFQFQKVIKPRILYFEEGDRGGAAFFEAAFGCFPDDALPYLPDAYESFMGGQKVVPSVGTWLDIVEGGAGYPLYYTFRGMAVRSSG